MCIVKRIFMLFVLLGFFYACSSTGTSTEQSTSTPIVANNEYQPPYSGRSFTISSDNDSDGIPDYLDIDPVKAATGASVQKSATNSNYVITENEFNNNIADANVITKPLPYWIRGSLKNGVSYYFDSDFFKITLKKGDRITILAYNGKINDSGLQIDFPTDTVFFNIAVSDSNGIKVFGRTQSLVNSTSGYSFEAPEDGSYFIEISYADLYSKDYELPYTLAIFYDKDFDGVSNDLEKVLGLNQDLDDSDGDGIVDYDEIYAFLSKLKSLKIAPAGTPNYFDIDGDKIPNWYDVDSDGDGIPDRIELARDLNKTGIGNFLNLDCNVNGKTDSKEAGLDPLNPIDSDKDGVYDFEDTDIDGDGIPNEIDNDPFTKIVQKSIFTDNIPKLYSVYSMDNGSLISENIILGKKLKIYGNFKSNNIRLLFPTLAGTNAITPIEVSVDNGTAVFDIPSSYDELSGRIALYENGEISNFLDVKIIKGNKPYIYYLASSDLISGNKVNINGNNLTNGDIQVCFSYDNNTVVCQNAKANFISVSATVPNNINSGYIFLNINGFVTNKVDYNIKRTVTANVVLGSGVLANNSNVKIFGAGEVYPLNTSMGANISVDKGIDYLAAFYYDNTTKNPYLLYEAIVPEGATSVTLNALSTAVKMVFFNLGLQIHLEKSKWNTIISTLSSRQSIIDLANYIDQLHASDKTKLNNFNDPTLIQKFKAAIQDGNSILQISSILKSATPSIKPNYSQYGISLYAYKDYIRLSNDTKSYLSVEVTDPKNKIALQDPDTGKSYVHISNPWSDDIVGTQAWGLLSIAKDQDYKVANRDSNFEIISAGVRSPRPSNTTVYGFVIVRTIFDGVVAIPFDEYVFKKILGKKIGSKKIVNILTEFIGAQNWNNFISTVVNTNSWGEAFKGMIWFPVSSAIEDCLQIPPGGKCQNLAKAIAKGASWVGLTQDAVANIIAKTVGKEILTYMTPAIGQIKATLETLSAINNIYTVAGTLYDMGSMAGLITFDIDYPLEITDAIPKCIKKEYGKKIEIIGNGFSPYYEGYLWNKKTINPEVKLGQVFGDIIALHPDGTRIIARFDASSLATGNHKIQIKHDNQQVISTFSIQVTDSGAAITNIKPTKGSVGTEIIVYGCGLETIDGFYFKGENGVIPATITYKSDNKIQVIVPKNAVTGPIYATSGSNKTNSLDFTVESTSVTIVYGDNGAATDDTFSLYVDGNLVSTMPTPLVTVTVNLNLTPGTHTVRMVGITAPDAIGTYYINFPSNVKVLSGPPLSGEDLTAGVTKTWIVEVLPISTSNLIKRSRIIGIQPE